MSRKIMRRAVCKDRSKRTDGEYVLFSKFIEDDGYDPPGTVHMSDDEFSRKLREAHPMIADAAVERLIRARKREE